MHCIIFNNNEIVVDIINDNVIRQNRWITVQKNSINRNNVWWYVCKHVLMA